MSHFGQEEVKDKEKEAGNAAGKRKGILKRKEEAAGGAPDEVNERVHLTAVRGPRGVS